MQSSVRLIDLRDLAGLLAGQGFLGQEKRTFVRVILGASKKPVQSVSPLSRNCPLVCA